MSREVNADTTEESLYRSLYAAACKLLPGRAIAVRAIDPRTLLPTGILATGELAPGVREAPPTIVRRALKHANVRDNLLRLDENEKESIPGVRLVDEHPLAFPGAQAGFSVPLLAGGQMLGEIHVNYPVPAGRKPAPSENLPTQADKALIIPIANHISAVVHMRRLLSETAYLQDYLGLLIDQASVLILATDLSGTITVWNRAMAQVTGFSRPHALGRDLAGWLGQVGVRDLGMLMRQVATSGEAATREVRLPSAGNVALRAAFNVVTVRGKGDQAAAVVGVGQDVTALRTLQSQMIHAEKLATVGQIAAGVAHEINNPLTSVQVCVDAVLRKAGAALDGKIPNLFDAADLDRLKKIREGSERIRRFAKDLVSYARPSGAELERVSLNDVVSQALSFCEHVLDEHHADVEQDLHQDLPPIELVRDQILQVVINLVTNAAQALPAEGGKVRARTWRSSDSSVGLAISDNGSGIKEDARAHVFEPFFTTKPPGRGTGLGLSIVRNIVFFHGGQITFQSRQGGGTTFVVTLPIARGGPRPPQGAEPRS